METVIIAQEATAAALGLTFLLASVVFLRLLDSVGEARMQLFGAFLLVRKRLLALGGIHAYDGPACEALDA